ncbi:hypothetical protein WJX72_011483 [[Myrmecia] bisecta]|uniref:Uncharacterized protein n=1 Tax=[Myrmecia] bisecta TaxID=41462 RepID=A0AAW1PIA4_9CHLO
MPSQLGLQSGPGSIQCKSGVQGKRAKARRPGTFEVRVITPPPESLGIHSLPANTHNGDQIEVNGQDYVVSGLVVQYKLVRGAYQREHHRLDVQQTGRYFLNLCLDNLYDAAGRPRR